MDDKVRLLPARGFLRERFAVRLRGVRDRSLVSFVFLNGVLLGLASGVLSWLLFYAIHLFGQLPQPGLDRLAVACLAGPTVGVVLMTVTWLSAPRWLGETREERPSA